MASGAAEAATRDASLTGQLELLQGRPLSNVEAQKLGRFQDQLNNLVRELGQERAWIARLESELAELQPQAESDTASPLLTPRWSPAPAAVPTPVQLSAGQKQQLPEKFDISDPHSLAPLCLAPAKPQYHIGSLHGEDEIGTPLAPVPACCDLSPWLAAVDVEGRRSPSVPAH